MKTLETIKNKIVNSKGLYKILGVSKSATLKQIKDEFKRKAKKLHPDLGGEEKEFLKILHAYSILRDPKKRKLYDETGEVEDIIKNDFAEMVEALGTLFDSALNSGLAENASVDLIEIMTNATAKAIDSARMEEATLKEDLKSLKDLQKRIKRKNKEANIFSNILDRKIEGKNKGLKVAKQTIKIRLMAKMELEEYDCITEVVDIVRYYSFSSSSTIS